MNPEEKKIMGLTVTSHSLVHLYEGVLPPLIPLMMVEFSTDYFHLGLIVTAFSYAFGFGSLPSGMLADRIGPRRLVTLYLFGAGILAMLVGAVSDLLVYGIIMGLIGLFCSTYHPASNTLLSLSIRERGRAFGIHGIAGSLGVAVTPALSAWIATAMGWRAPHVLFGLLGLGVALYSLTVPRPSREVPDRRRVAQPGSSLSRHQFIMVLFLFLSATALGLTYKGIMTFLPAYLGERIHFTAFDISGVALGGMTATFALLSGAVGQYVSGRLLDRYRAETLFLAAVIIGMVCVLLMAFASGLALLAAAVAYAFFYFSTQPTQNFLVSRYLPPHRQGLGYGILFFVTFGVGSTAAAVSGYLADRYGLQSVFFFMAICFAVSALMIAVMVHQAVAFEQAAAGRNPRAAAEDVNP